jgi:hypothetical protein
MDWSILQSGQFHSSLLGAKKTVTSDLANSDQAELTDVSAEPGLCLSHIM